MTCDWCERTDSITVINGMHACIHHIDNAMANVFAPLKALREDLDGHRE